MIRHLPTRGVIQPESEGEKGMHFIMAIIGVLGAAAFWWYRMKDAGKAAGEVIDTAQRVRGSIRRRNFRKKAGQSAFAAIDDPIIGAATLIVALADEAQARDPGLDDALRSALASVSNADAAEEAVIYGRWAMKDTPEASTAFRLISPMLNEKLSPDEREQLVAMARDVVGPHAENGAALRAGLVTLRQRLGLQVD